MAAADITKAQIATFFGTDLTAATIYNFARSSIQTNVDLRGKYFALIGDDGGTPLCVGHGDSIEQLRTYIGMESQRSVAEGTTAPSVHFIPKGMT